MIVSSTFRPAWWLPGAHLQTLFPNLLRRRAGPSLRRERLELPDGDFVDLDWGAGPDHGPWVLILHGLEGSVRSSYAAGILDALASAGYQAVLMHFRGCSGEPNRLPRSYHSGETGDLDYVVRHLRARAPGRALGVLGYSLGGNVLLKWLGEQGPQAPVACAIAVSVPFDLAQAACRLERGFSRVYQWYLLRQLRGSVSRKARRLDLPVASDRLRRARTFRHFDDLVTAPLHGFRDADDYYRRSSSRGYLRHIAIPTLILQAADDPFMSPAGLPRDGELSAAVTLELSPRGGHVGFVTGTRPWRPRYWLEERIARELTDRLPA
ncbi:MAG TPA: hydrolase [Gammaproteobacteria bacterium]|nr:hydrolase [Gammaproteobacteria bacterium]